MHEHWIPDDDDSDGQRTVLQIRGRPIEWNQEQVLARWLQQIRRDTSAQQMALRQLVTGDPDYSRLFWNLRQLGEAKRLDALAVLNHRYGKKHLQDPRKDVPYSQKSILEAAALSSRVGFSPAYPMFRKVLPDEVQYRARPLQAPTPYAWIHLQPNNPPILLVEPGPVVPEELAVFEAAATLGFYLKHARELHAVPYDQVLYVPEPHEDKVFTPMLHSFAQGLFNLDGCPIGRHVAYQYHCWCTRIVYQFNQVPAAHPLPTGTLSAGRVVPVQETGQQEALMMEALHDAANVSPFVARGMTPPASALPDMPGMPGDIQPLQPLQSLRDPVRDPLRSQPTPPPTVDQLDTARLDPHRYQHTPPPVPPSSPPSPSSSPPSSHRPFRSSPQAPRGPQGPHGSQVPDETEDRPPRERSSGS